MSGRALLPSGTFAALAMYVQRPTLRGNFWLLVAAGALAMAGWNVPHLVVEIRRHGVASALYSREALNTWWMGAFYAAAAVSASYWGRVGSNIAPMMPTLLAAERAAGAIAIVLAECLLAAPLVVLGGAPASALALTALASFGGFGFGRGATVTGQGRRRQGVLTLVYLPLLFVGTLDSVMKLIGNAPAWIDAPIGIGVIAAAIASLQFRPAEARQQEDEQERARESWMARRPAGTIPPGLLRVLDWRPAPLREQPLPPGPFNPGTLMLVLQTLAILLVGLAFGWVISALGGGKGAGSHDRIQSLMGSAAAMPVLGASVWLMSRGEWTRIFVAGRYGSRRRFAATLIRAHLWRTAHLSVIIAVVLGVLLVVFRLDPPRDGLLRAAVTGLMVMAACQLGCLCAMASGLSKLWTGAGNFGGMMIVNVAAVTLLTHGFAPIWYGVVAAAAFLAVAAMLGFGAAALQRTDWTPEDSTA